MKKSLLLSMLVASLLISTTVLAFPADLGILKVFSNKDFRMPLVEKNPTDWSVVEDGAWGLLNGHYGRYLNFWGRGLEGNTDYTLIYYGYDGHNDEWPYATCIGDPITTSSNGWTGSVVRMFDYSSFIGDGINQKFWLVLSSDLDCDNNRMIAWNPTEYLFEWDII